MGTYNRPPSQHAAALLAALRERLYRLERAPLRFPVRTADPPAGELTDGLVWIVGGTLRWYAGGTVHSVGP